MKEELDLYTGHQLSFILMARSLLPSFKPALQIQLFLTTLFQLEMALKSISSENLLPLLIQSPLSFSPWQIENGILNQLKTRLDCLIKSTPHPQLLEIASVIEKAHLDSHSLNFEWATPLFNLTAEFLNTLEPDENLYFFLLRHQEDCKRTFGRMFLLNLFKKKHLGLKQTEQFLITKYQERGFLHLKTLIRSHMTGLTRC